MNEILKCKTRKAPRDRLLDEATRLMSELEKIDCEQPFSLIKQSELVLPLREKLDLFLRKLRRYVTDYGTEEHDRRFRGNAMHDMLLDVRQQWRYLKSDCLDDLQSFKTLLKQIAMRPRKSRRRNPKLPGELKAARENAVQTQEEASAEIGTDQPTYSAWENGRRTPGRANRIAIRDYIRRYRTQTPQ